MTTVYDWVRYGDHAYTIYRRAADGDRLIAAVRFDDAVPFQSEIVENICRVFDDQEYRVNFQAERNALDRRLPL
jgi:hypothetical protein